jgi:putative membrane protein
MLLDALFSYGHFLAIGALVAFLAMETALVRSETFTPAILKRMALIDAGLGASGVSILLFGAGRVFYGLKGSEYYLGNHVFWTKMALIVLTVLASVPPTINILRWRKASAADPAFQPPERKLRSVRGHIIAEWVLLTLIPIAAVAMARGVGG